MYYILHTLYLPSIANHPLKKVWIIPTERVAIIHRRICLFNFSVSLKNVLLEKFLLPTWLSWNYGYAHLEMSLFKSVPAPEPFLKTVISADVSLLFLILDIKSGSRGGGPAIETAEVIILLFRPPKVRPRSAKVPLRTASEVWPKEWF